MPDAPLRWLFLDFDSYFAAVEQQEDARLRDRPLVVVPLADTEATGAIAVSRQARRLGIRRGMMLAEIRRVCPEVAVRVARHDVYVRWHHRLLDEIARHALIDMVHSIDELSIRLDKRQRQPARARALGRAIKEGIAARVGVALSCSVGIAPSRLLAKIAAEMDKPDGLRLLTGADLPGAIADLPLEELPGISGRMSRRLAAAGVRDVAALWRLAPKQARAIWGSVSGERFIRALHGEDVDPPPPRPPASFGHGRVLAPQMRQPPAAWPVACALLLKAAARLRRSGQVAGALLLMVRWQTPQPGPDRWEARFVATSDSFALLRRLEGLWAALQRAARQRRDGRLRSVQVLLHRVQPQAARQLDLFEAFDGDQLARERLWAEIDRLNRRFGLRCVQPASLRHLDLPWLGAKIAFGRVPDPEEF